MREPRLSSHLKRNYLLDQVFFSSNEIPVGKVFLPIIILRPLRSRKFFYDHLVAVTFTATTSVVVRFPTTFLDQAYFWSNEIQVEEFFLRPSFHDHLVVVRSFTTPLPSKLLSLEAGGLDDEDLIILISLFICNSYYG